MSETTTRQASDGETAHPPLAETRELSKGQAVSVRKTITGFEDVMGGEDIARIQFGGGRSAISAEGDYSVETVKLVNVHDTTNPDYADLVARARAMGIEPSDTVLLTFSPTDIYAAAAFVENGKPNRLGKKGSLKWLDRNPDEKRPLGWNPFQKNFGVADQQFTLTAGESKIVIVSDADASQSRTQVSSLGFEPGLAIVTN